MIFHQNLFFMENVLSRSTAVYWNQVEVYRTSSSLIQSETNRNKWIITERCRVLSLLVLIPDEEI